MGDGVVVVVGGLGDVFGGVGELAGDDDGWPPVGGTLRVPFAWTDGTLDKSYRPR